MPRCARRPGCTFDRVDSDGCMSTNDTVLLLASGASGVEPDRGELAAAVQRRVRRPRPRSSLADAEGATQGHRDRGASAPPPRTTPSTSARAVSRSNLLKCALHGEDPNWGRILAAVGTTDAAFDPLAIDAAINGVWVCRDSAPGEDVGDGRHVRAGGSTSRSTCRSARRSATVWSNDLTAAYVHENSAYST